MHSFVADELEEDKTEGLTGRALAGTGWSTIATVGKQVLTLASVMTVARILGPRAYGVMNMAVIVTAFISNFRDLGTASAIIQKPTVSRSLLSSLFWVNVAVGAALSGLICLGAPLAAEFFHSPDVLPVLQVLSFSMLLASCGVVHNAILSRAMRFKAIAITDLVSAATAYIVALTTALAGAGVWSLVYASLAASLITAGGYVVASRFRPGLSFDVGEVMSIARYSSNLSAFGIVNYGYRNADNLIVGRVLGGTALGYYAMAYNLMLTPISNVSSVIAQVLMPAFSRIQDDNERFRSAFIRATMLTGLITFPMMAGLGVTADPLIRAVLGSKWIGAIVPFEILAVVGLVQSVHTITGIVFQAKGRTDWLFRWSLVVLVSTLSAFLIGVHFGIVGVASAYAIVFLGLLTVPGFAIAFKLIELKLSEFGLALLPQLLITAGMTLICIAWQAGLVALGQNNSWLRLISTVVVGAATYLFGLAFFRPRVLGYVDELLRSSDRALARLAIDWLRRLKLGPPVAPGSSAAEPVL
jgi:PST family polysaccharide transporter